MYAVSVTLAVMLANSQPSAALDHEDHHKAMAQCANACADCMVVCDGCARHCFGMVAEGKKEHAITAGFCADCADVCAAAAKVTARGGPLAHATCEACAKACDECAAACEKFPGDDHMVNCAKECRSCAKACRDMLASHKHDHTH